MKAPGSSFHPLPGLGALRIPIFLKLAALTAFLVVGASLVVSFTLLKRQEARFVEQLLSLGEGLTSLAANNAGDKILGDEDLALFQLVKDIAQDDQVLFAAITDQKGVVRADSRMEQINHPLELPSDLTRFKSSKGVRIRTFTAGSSQALLFEKPVLFQGVRVGTVYLAITQARIQENIRAAKRSIVLLTSLIALLGILLSLGLSLYFSSPIRRLREGSKAVGGGDFHYRVKVRRNDELGDLAAAFNAMAEGLAERERIRETFGRYVTPEIRDEILSGRIPLDGERRVATVLFSDLRDFTPYVEQNPPEQVIKGIRDYFTEMEAAVRQHDGLVLQYVGDELEGIFGVPLLREDHAYKGVLAALEMRRRLEILNRDREAKGLPPFRHGIGVHTGEVLAGNSGSHAQPTYTLIGDTVNLASRLQDLTKVLKWDILASEQTVAQLPDAFRLEKAPPQRVKGYSRPLGVYRVLGHIDESP